MILLLVLIEWDHFPVIGHYIFFEYDSESAQGNDATKYGYVALWSPRFATDIVFV